MPVRRQSQCKEPSNGLTIRKDTASSGAMMAQTFSFTIPQSPGMDIALCKRETRSSLKLSKGLKVPKPRMCRNPAVERFRNHSAGRERPSAGHFLWSKVQETEEIKEVKEKLNRAAHSKRWKRAARRAFSAPYTSSTSFGS